MYLTYSNIYLFYEFFYLVYKYNILTIKNLKYLSIPICNIIFFVFYYNDLKTISCNN